MKITNISVELIDHMGTDLTVVNAARVSFDKESEWVFSDDDIFDVQLKEADAKLIRYLANHNHWSPFAHTAIQLRVKAPIFIARQLVKHQVGGVWNEVSRRYVDSEPEFWLPSEVRGRPEGSVKQGSGAPVENQKFVKEIIEWRTECALDDYKELIAEGVAPEQARMVLPLNTMTEWYWTGSLMFWARVCKQRLDGHAQQEAQEVAQLISKHMEMMFPVSWAALMSNSPKEA